MAIAAGLLATSRRPEWIVDRPRWVLAGLAAISIGAAAALVDPVSPGFRIALDASEEPLMVRGDPARPLYDEAARTFGSDDLYVIAMLVDDVFTQENLTALRRISQRVLGLPGVRRAESLVDINAYRYDSEHEWLDVTRFISEIPSDPGALDDLRRRALADPIYPKLVVGSGGRAAAINLAFRKLPDREFIARDLDGRIRAIAADEARSGRSFAFAGRPHVKSRTYHVMVGDLLRLIPLSILVAAVVVFLMTGSPRGVVLPLGACLMAALWTFGLLALLGVPLNLISIVLGPILISLGGLYGVHVMGRYEIELATAANGREAALSTLRYALLPVVIAGGTTCVGFAALLLAEIPGTEELGLFAVFGIASLTGITLTGIPACLALLPPPNAIGASGGPRAQLARRLDAGLDGLARLCCRRPTAVLAAWALVTLAALAAIPRIVIDTDYLTFFDARSSVRRDFATVRERLSGPVPLYVELIGDREGVFREPANLRAIERLQRELDDTPGVAASVSVVDILRLLNRALEEDDPAEERIPDVREAVSDLVFLVPKHQMRRFANSNHSRANVLVRTGELGSRSVRNLVTRIEQAIERAQLPPGLRHVVTGNAVVLNRSADVLAGSQLSTVGAAAAAIFAIVWIVFRSAPVGALAMTPNVVPVVVFFGVLGLGAAPLSLPTSLIGSVTLGIAIDDTVHFLVGYRRQRAGGASPEAAIAVTLRRVGRPIVITSAMLVAGFLTITLSGFATIREFGLLSALTMAICLSSDLLLLPALLVRARV